MKSIWRLMWVYILLIVRVPLSLFFNMILPLAFFVFYAGFLSHAKGPDAGALVIRLIALGILSNGLFGLSITLVVMRERDILRRYHLAPISAFQVVSSRLLANYMMFLIVTIMELGAAKVLFSLHIGPVLFQLLLLFSLGYLAIAGIGFIIAAIVNTVSDAQVYNQLVFFGLMFISGIAVPLSLLPRTLQLLAAFVPSSLTIVGANELLLRPDSPLVSWPEMLCLAVISIVTLCVATLMFRWEKEAKVTAGDRLKAAVILVPVVLAGMWLNGIEDFTARIAMTGQHSSSSSRP
jgi:ABC-2 type transport system permease protein